MSHLVVTVVDFIGKKVGGTQSAFLVTTFKPSKITIQAGCIS
jgi:hypothetical protein